MPKYKMLDLFSGLGGASYPYTLDDDWDVVRVDYSGALFHDTYLSIPGATPPAPLPFDLRRPVEKLYALVGRDYDLVWASPPCYEFSLAHNFHGGRSDEPNLELMLQAKKIIDDIKPRWWCIENVQGACAHFMPHLGKHTSKIGPYYLWGNLSTENIVPPGDYYKCQTGSKTKFRQHRNAKIPLWLSQRIKDQLFSQRRLTEWA